MNTELQWQDYPGTINRTEPQQYRWRLPLREDPSQFITFIAWTRRRGAGYSDVISPAFDYWDGYKIIMPVGLQWQVVEQSEMKQYNYRDIQIEGVTLDPCPFCGLTPTWKGSDTNWQGTSIGAFPHRFNTWWLTCCSWAKTPRLPALELIKRRAELLNKHSTSL